MQAEPAATSAAVAAPVVAPRSLHRERAAHPPQLRAADGHARLEEDRLEFLPLEAHVAAVVVGQNPVQRVQERVSDPRGPPRKGGFRGVRGVPIWF